MPAKQDTHVKRESAHHVLWDSPNAKASASTSKPPPTTVEAVETNANLAIPAKKENASPLQPVPPAKPSVAQAV